MITVDFTFGIKSWSSSSGVHHLLRGLELQHSGSKYHMSLSQQPTLFHACSLQIYSTDKNVCASKYAGFSVFYWALATTDCSFGSQFWVAGISPSFLWCSSCLHLMLQNNHLLISSWPFMAILLWCNHMIHDQLVDDSIVVFKVEVESHVCVILLPW